MGRFALTVSPVQTCWRRFQRWVREGVRRSVLEALAEDLNERGELDFSERFIDGTFVVAKKGALSWKDQARQSTKLMAVAHGDELPSHNPHNISFAA